LGSDLLVPQQIAALAAVICDVNLIFLSHTRLAAKELKQLLRVYRTDLKTSSSATSLFTFLLVTKNIVILADVAIINRRAKQERST
jgi:hypothetical protein